MIFLFFYSCYFNGDSFIYLFHILHEGKSISGFCKLRQWRQWQPKTSLLSTIYWSPMAHPSRLSPIDNGRQCRYYNGDKIALFNGIALSEIVIQAWCRYSCYCHHCLHCRHCCFLCQKLEWDNLSTMAPLSALSRTRETEWRHLGAIPKLGWSKGGSKFGTVVQHGGWGFGPDVT